jgi:hypothetical protein
MDPVTLGLCSQIDLDFEVNRAAKERPTAVIDRGQTLVPAEVTTAAREAPVNETSVFGDTARPALEDEEEDLDVNSVFAKLKTLK